MVESLLAGKPLAHAVVKAYLQIMDDDAEMIELVSRSKQSC